MKEFFKYAAGVAVVFVIAAVAAQPYLPEWDNLTAQSQDKKAASDEKQDKNNGNKENQAEKPKQSENDTKAKQQDKQKQAESKSSAEQKEQTKSKPEEKPTTSENQNAYIYVAQPSDSYAQMARKAIQTYGINNDVTLSQAEIIMAETNLTIQAGSPLLDVGQEVAINVSAVEQWVEKAQAMSPAKESAWQRYVPGVNFNTDRVGQPN